MPGSTIGFILTTLFVNYSFHGRGKRLILTNWLMELLVMGAIIGGMRI